MEFSECLWPNTSIHVDTALCSTLAALSSIAIILSLLFDPFLQQVVAYRDRLVPLNKDASIVRAQRYLAPSYEGLALPSVVDLSMKVWTSTKWHYLYSSESISGCYIWRYLRPQQSGELRHRASLFDWQVCHNRSIYCGMATEERKVAPSNPFHPLP